jgi:F-type H+-transporting ATPase subunit epsilon
MAEGTHLEIVSPERLVISETVTSVTVPGSEGYFTVLGDHAPLMTTLKPGFITVVAASGTQSIYIEGGFAEISPEGLTILAEDARPAADFDRAEIDARIGAAQKALDSADTIEAKDVAQTELDSWRNLLLEAATVAGPAH